MRERYITVRTEDALKELYGQGVQNVHPPEPRFHDDVSPPAPYDAVKNPPHYAQHEIQPIEFIIQNNIGYCAGNVIKYVCRHNLKDGIQDLKKAREYIDIMIKAAEEKGAEYDKYGD